MSSHDVERARAFDLVICLNGRQVAFGPPATTLDRETLEETYGGELIVLDEAGSARAITIHHHGTPWPRPRRQLIVSGIELRSMLELVLAGGFCGALGFWVVERAPDLRRRVALARPAARRRWPGWRRASLLLGAAGGAIVAAALIALAARDANVGPDTGTAVAVTGLVGLGSLLALAPDAPQRLEELLFGNPLGVTGGDLVAAAAAVLVAAGGGTLVALRRPLTATAFDPAGASALGLRPSLLRLALLVLLAAAVAVTVQGLGALLVLAALVAPPLRSAATCRPRPGRCSPRRRWPGSRASRASRSRRWRAWRRGRIPWPSCSARWPRWALRSPPRAIREGRVAATTRYSRIGLRCRVSGPSNRWFLVVVATLGCCGG